jgi:cytochrome c oxidase subunit 4
MTALRPLLAAWGGLMALLLLQLASALLLHLPMSASIFGLAEAAIIVIVFMRIRSASPLMHIFAAAGVFWLLVLLVLGNLDPVTRTDLPVQVPTEPL